jgi:hypothetical protein
MPQTALLEPACIDRFFSGIRQTDFRETAEAHFARLAVEHEAKRPALCATTANPKIEPPSIGIESWFARAGGRQRAQPLDILRHNFRPIWTVSATPTSTSAEPLVSSNLTCPPNSDCMIDCLKCPPNPTRRPTMVDRIPAAGAEPERTLL